MNNIVFDCDGEGVSFHFRFCQICSRCDVVFPSVPWTGDDGADKFSFVQRAASMATGVIDGEEISGDIKNGNGLFTDAGRRCSAGDYFGCVANSYAV